MRRNTLIAVSVSSSIIVIGLVTIVLILLLGGRGGHEVIDEAVEAERAADEARTLVRSPWADRETEAVRMVSRHRVGDETVQQRIQSGLLARHVDLIRRLAEDQQAQWVASQIEESSIYTVSWRYRDGEVPVGPRWLVQVDPEGPEALTGGRVVAVNALATLVETGSPGTLGPFLNRTDEVIRALTNHRFDDGLRLGSALIVRFFGLSRSMEDLLEQMKGWTVVPERLEPDERLLYTVHLQWTEGERALDAQWEVNLADASFQPRNLLAYDLMRSARAVPAALVDEMQMPRVQGELMDLTTPPAAEPSEARRALRWVLHDERVAEAAAVLLGFRRTRHEIEDIGWRARQDDERGWWHVQYVFNQDGEEDTLSWRVLARNGTVQAESDIARAVTFFLSSESP
ncbi:MAG: hypothetical protein EA398_03375 [Deltaproteobacteria bacterium]|nr:MAG: hypothetical protein EA398_03375 [Deltaproteobacteria bacterium]